MTFEEKFLAVFNSKDFQRDLKELRIVWDLNQKKYKTVLDVIKDGNEILLRDTWSFTKEEKQELKELWNYYIKIGRKLRQITLDDLNSFWDDLEVLVRGYNLPTRFSLAVFDYLAYGKYKEQYPKVRVELDWEEPFTDIGDVKITLSPDARLSDVKAAWGTVLRLRGRTKYSGDRKTQKLRKPYLYTDIYIPELKGEKISAGDIRDKVYGQEQYFFPSSEFRQLTSQLKKAKHTSKYRYKKALKKHPLS